MAHGDGLAVVHDGEGDFHSGDLVGHAAQVGRGLGQVAEGEAGGVDAQVSGVVGGVVIQAGHGGGAVPGGIPLINGSGIGHQLRALDDVVDPVHHGVQLGGVVGANLHFFDNLGYSYTAKFAIKPRENSTVDGQYHITLTDIIDSSSRSILGNTDAEKKANINSVFGNGYDIDFDANEGTFVSIGGNNKTSQMLNLSALRTGYTTNGQNGQQNVTSNFQNIELDFSKCMNYYNGGTSTFKMLKGDTTGDGAGKKLGALTGITIDQQGQIHGSYDNGNTVLLGQIPVAQFANASGLEKVGNNCYQTTLNSGEFDGIGVEVSADGSAINSGELEMSNVDLSGQFTDMIVTQRGFQANSRVITVSDTLLEELINLKR